MSFEIDLNTYLQDNITTTDEVSSDISNTNESKYLVFHKISTARTYSHDGPDGTETARYQFDAYANKKVDTLNIIKEVKDKLENFQGWMEDTQVHGVFVIDEFGSHEKETGLYRNELELEFQYYE